MDWTSASGRTGFRRGELLSCWLRSTKNSPFLCTRIEYQLILATNSYLIWIFGIVLNGCDSFHLLMREEEVQITLSLDVVEVDTVIRETYGEDGRIRTARYTFDGSYHFRD